MQVSVRRRRSRIETPVLKGSQLVQAARPDRPLVVCTQIHRSAVQSLIWPPWSRRHILGLVVFIPHGESRQGRKSRLFIVQYHAVSCSIISSIVCVACRYDSWPYIVSVSPVSLRVSSFPIARHNAANHG